MIYSVTQTLSSEIEITWEDGHVSVFSLDWLAARSFRRENRERFRRSVSQPQVLWGRELLDNVPTADYGEVMKSDAALLDWLENLDRFGFVLVRNVPVEEGPVPALQVRKISQHPSFKYFIGE